MGNERGVGQELRLAPLPQASAIRPPDMGQGLDPEALVGQVYEERERGGRGQSVQPPREGLEASRVGGEMPAMLGCVPMPEIAMQAIRCEVKERVVAHGQSGMWVMMSYTGVRMALITTSSSAPRTRVRIGSMLACRRSIASRTSRS